MAARYTRGTSYTKPRPKKAYRPQPSPKPFSRPADTTPVAVIKPQYRGTPAAARGAPRAHVATPTATKPPRRGPSTLQKVTRQARRRIRRQAEDTRTQQRVERARRAISKTPSPRAAKLAVRFGRKKGVSPSILMGLMEQESNFNPHAEGPPTPYGTAKGATQFIDSTAKMYGVKQGKLRSQVRGAAAYLKDLGIQQDPVKALGGYYGSATERLPSGKTYPTEVLEKSNRYKRLDKLTPKVAKKVPTPKPSKQLPGPWSGSKRYASKIIPKGITPTSDKRTPEHNASVKGSPTSDHLTTSKGAWAYDFADDPKISSAIARNLGIKGFKHGQNTTVYRDGYRIQLLTAPHGTGPHVHLGIKWEGAGAEGSAGAGGFTTSGVAGAPAGSAAGTKAGPGGRAGRARRRGQLPGGMTLRQYLRSLNLDKEATTAKVEVPERLKEAQEERTRRARATRVRL